MTGAQSYFISAGEISGDLLAADLILELKALLPNLEPFGNVGDAMISAGAAQIFHIRDLSTMGISDVFKRLGEFRIMESNLLEQIDRRKPAFAILVDFPGLHFHLAEQLKLRGIPVIQYVAPKTWAWGEHRCKKLRDHFDLVLSIFPFEEEYFQQRSVKAQYVGTPHLDRVSRIKLQPQNLGFSSQDEIVAMLPGSRISELEHLLPILIKVHSQLKSQLPNYQGVMPLAGSITKVEFFDLLRQLGLGQLLQTISSGSENILADVDGLKVFQGMSLELLSISRAGFIASGTASIEAALLNIPHVVGYRMSSTTYAYAKEHVKTPFISLPNILLGRAAVPEYVQQMDPSDIARQLHGLMTDTEERRSQLAAFHELAATLRGSAAGHAAKAIYSMVGSA
jgi:lipid-A-disaccharide synthase